MGRLLAVMKVSLAERKVLFLSRLLFVKVLVICVFVCCERVFYCLISCDPVGSCGIFAFWLLGCSWL